MSKSVRRFRTVYDPSIDPGIDTGSESHVKQQFAAECDVNAIVDRFAKTGLLTSTNSKQPTYEDFSDSSSYMDAVLVVQEAENNFALLPAYIRDRFRNDPSTFLDFVNNPANGPELIKMGLATPRVDDRYDSSNLDPSSSNKEEPVRSSKSKKGLPAVGEGPDA